MPVSLSRSLCSLCPSLTCTYLLILLPLTLPHLLCPANFFHCPFLSAVDFFTSYGRDSLPVHVSFYAERPVPLKTPLWLLCFSKTELLRLRMGSTSSSLLKFSYFLQLIKYRSTAYHATGAAAPCSCVIWTLSGTKAHVTDNTRYSRIGSLTREDANY